MTSRHRRECCIQDGYGVSDTIVYSQSEYEDININVSYIWIYVHLNHKYVKWLQNHERD